ncbi:endonuclease [Shigella sonnei]|nr:endonuclease [Shigella sonnei]
MVVSAIASAALMRHEFILPYPPTVNTYWRRRGSTYFVSKVGERYRRDVTLIVRQQRLKLNLSGRLAIKIIAEPPDKRRRDLDNILKAPLDALTHAGLLIDDEQFDEINIVRGQLVPGGRLGVKIYEITGDNDGA